MHEWAAAAGIIRSAAARDRFRGTAPGELAGRVYATAADPARLETATAWIGWLFLIDDQLDEGETGRDPVLTRKRLRPFVAMAAEMAGEDAAETEPFSPGRSARLPLLAALRDIWRGIGTRMPADWCAEFARHYSDYLRGCEWEARNRVRGRTPDEHEFLPKRRDAGAIWPSLDLLEYVAAAPVPDHLRRDPLLTAIRTACADVVCWTDDLLTVAKERAHGDVHNLAIVLERATGCDTRTALRMVAQRIETRVTDFWELRRRIGAASFADGALETHVEGLHHWMRGHLEWALRTVRYDTTAAPAAYLEDLWPDGA